jgi:cold shock protein
MSESGQTRLFNDVGSMSGLPESGHGWRFMSTCPRQLSSRHQQLPARLDLIRLHLPRLADAGASRFNTDRGFGFILPDDGGPDIFVQVHDVENAGMKTLVAGQVLVYNTAPARDGRLKAVNLRLL